MALLESIRGPEDIRRLGRDQLQPLADEVRRRLIDVVSQTGGHIGAGLGVVELTVALGYCFDSPRDRSEEHTSELQSRSDLVCRLLLEKKNALPINLI